MTAGGSRHRFELTRLEIAGVVISAAASLFIVFLLGVYAGRGLGERRLADEARVVRLPVEPAAEETAGSEPDELTFDETLARGDRGPVPHDQVAAEPRQPSAGEQKLGADTAPAEPGPARAGEQAGHDAAAGSLREESLTGDAAASARRGTEPVAASAPAVGGAAPNPENARPAPGVPPAPRDRIPDARVAVALAPPPAGATSPAVEHGDWSVQVTATREAHTADDLVRRLRAKGYDAYVVKARRQGGMFYRVRVGHYPNMERAGQMVSRLRREPGVPEAFVASD